MRKRIGCLLLTLALCVGLLPMTAWAAPTPITGNLDIAAKINGGTHNEDKLSDNGYKWSWDAGAKKLTMQMKDFQINSTGSTDDNGDLILPNVADATIEIILEGENQIKRNLKFPDDVGNKINLVIKKADGATKGELTVEFISGTGGGGKVTVQDGAKVAVTKKFDIGASGGSNAYLEVDGTNSEITIKDQPLLITGIAVTNGGKVIVEKGIQLAEKSDATGEGDYIGQIGGSGGGKIEIGDTGSADKPALFTGGTVGASAEWQKALLQDLITNGNIPSGHSVDKVLNDDDGTTVKYYAIYKDGIGVATKLTLEFNDGELMPPGDGDSDGDDDSDSSGRGNGSHRTRWYEIEPIPSDGCSIDVVEKEKEHVVVDVTVNVKDGYLCKGIIVLDGKGNSYKVRPQADGTFQFTMPDKDVTVEAILEKIENMSSSSKSQQYILLTIDELDAWVFTHWETMDVPPVIRDGRTMLPARFVIEALGGTVAWDADAQKVTIEKDGRRIIIVIGAEFAEVDGKAVALDSPAFLENGRTYLPLRFIAENLGADVAWDAESRTVTITA